MNAELFGGAASYWQEIVDHTAYDEFWKTRSLWKFMDGVTVGVGPLWTSVVSGFSRTRGHR
jgi:hypothetical protein